MTQDRPVNCNDDYPIFVQSSIGNLKLGWEPKTVVKVDKNNDMVIFDLDIFYDLLARSVELGYENVFKIESLCRVNISFITGWGSLYKLQKVHDAPCWITVQFSEPLESLNTILQEYTRFEDEVSSIDDF